MYKKYINIVRIRPGGLCILLFMIFLHANVSGFAQQRRISLDEVNTPLRAIFKKIKSQTGVGFIVTSSMLADAKPVTIKVSNAGLDEVLPQLFRDQQLTYTIRKNTVAVTRKVPRKVVNEVRRSSQLKGNIKDESGNPIPGVTVMVEGAEIYTRSDNDGNFSMDMVVGGTLVFSHIGYERKMYPLNGQNEFLVTLTVAANKLGEVSVVSTGYQNINKERATGSFSKPNMDVFKNRTGTMDIANRLEGLVPGLLIKQGFNSTSTEDPNIPNGKTTNKAVIRGSSTIELQTEPLYVVDGIPITNINQFNPEDIEDITVLKDAAAAAIWGARASNGVIVINTKRALKNSGLNISYSGFVNFQGKPQLRYDNQLNSAQYIQVARELFDPVQFPYQSLGLYDAIAPHEQLLYDNYNGKISTAQLNRGLDSLSNLDNSKQIKDLFYRNAVTQNHSVSISGGSNVYSFYSSAAYTNVKSSVIGQENKTYRLMFNQEYNPTRRLKLTLSTTLGYNTDNGINSKAIDGKFLPYQLFQDGSGANTSMGYLQGLRPEIRADYEQRSRVSLDYNPYSDLYTKEIKTTNLHVNIAGGVNLKLFKGLSFQGNYGYQKAPGRRTDYTDHSNYNLRMGLVAMTVAPTAADAPIYYLPTSGGTYIESNYDQYNWTLRNQLVYATSIRKGKDQLNLQVGQEAREQFGRSISTTLLGYNQQLLNYFTPTLNNGYLPNTVTGGTYVSNGLTSSLYESQNRFNSYFALLNYTFDGKYSLDGSWRVDHSALFGSDKSAQNKPIYSVGGKWNIQREKFMDEVKWLNALSLRATYGITGNSPFAGSSATQWDVLLTPSFFTTPIAGTYADVTPKNDKLSWESTATTNVGIDFSLFGGRLSGGLDAYYKKTTDMLGSIEINPLNGFVSGRGNIGTMKNKGVEVSLSSINIRTPNFSWSSNFNIAYNQNKLISFSKTDPRSNSASSRFMNPYLVGYGLQPIFSYVYAGLNNEGNPMIRLADGTTNSTPYVEKVEDLVYNGSAIPKYTGGFSNTFSYKAFSLTANMVFNLGNVMRANVNTFYTGRLSTATGIFEGNLTTDFLNRWKKPGDEAFTNIPSYIAGYESYNRSTEYYNKADINVVSAAYAKIRDITLSYRLPELLLSKIKVKSANVSVQATNFMVWKANDRGIDPEFHDLTSGNTFLAPYRHAYSISTTFSF